MNALRALKWAKFTLFMVLAAFVGFFISIKHDDTKRMSAVLLDLGADQALADAPSDPGSGGTGSGDGSGDAGGSGDSGDCGGT